MTPVPVCFRQKRLSGVEDTSFTPPENYGETHRKAAAKGETCEFSGGGRIGDLSLKTTPKQKKRPEDRPAENFVNGRGERNSANLNCNHLIYIYLMQPSCYLPVSHSVSHFFDIKNVIPNIPKK